VTTAAQLETHAVAERVLTAERWREVGRRLVAKLLSELLYEEVLRATPEGPGRYRIELGDGTAYRFRARRRLFDTLRVEPGSVRREGSTVDLEDPVELLLELREPVEIDPATTAHLVRELSATLVADAHAMEGHRRLAAELVDLDYAEVEGELDGHPWIAANRGRVGFGYGDLLAYAPERGRPMRPLWLAARRPWASYQAVGGLDHDKLVEAELDPPAREAFAARLAARAVDPGAYAWLPVHPWQWEHVVLPLFAAELAGGDLVVLGEEGDDYLPQQSVRTLSNRTAPARHHLKLPLSVLNTLVWRGCRPTGRWPPRPSPPGSRGCATAIPTCARSAAWCCSARSPAWPSPTAPTRRCPARRTSSASCSAASGASRWSTSSSRTSGRWRWPPCCTPTPPARRWSPP
jgi:siderophore synthetase component